jgi:uncharacterized protein (DUF3084 family)
MTTTGKALTIINLFLSFLFLGFAAYVISSHIDLAGMLRAARTERQTAEQRRNEIQEVVTKLEEAKTAEEARLKEAENQNTQRAAGLNTKIEELAAELTAARQKVDQTGNQLRDIALQQQQRRENVDALRVQLAGINGETDQLQLEKRELENQLAQAMIALEELKTRNDQIVRRIADLENSPLLNNFPFGLRTLPYPPPLHCHLPHRIAVAIMTVILATWVVWWRVRRAPKRLVSESELDAFRLSSL